MKLFSLLALILFASTLILQAAPMYLPARATTVSTQAIGDEPACSATIELDENRKHITHAILITGDKKYVFPVDTLLKIEFPDPSSLKIETEVGRGGEKWYSIVLSPARHTKRLTRYRISVIDGTFAQVTKMWDEAKKDHTKRHFETLYQNKAEQGGADQPATARESKSESDKEPRPESEGRSK